MDLDGLTIGEAKKLAKLFGGTAPNSHSLDVGAKYFIRTVTYHHVGMLDAITDTDLVLSSASWVASSGRWNEALRTGKLDEVEPHVNGVIISRAAIVDCVLWGHNLPTEVK